MSFVDNPHQTTAENNLVVTSYLNEAQNILSIKFAKDANNLIYSKTNSYYPEGESPCGPGIYGEYSKEPNMYNIIAIDYYVGSSYSCNIAIDELTYNLLSDHQRNLAIIDKNDSKSFLKINLSNLQSDADYYDSQIVYGPDFFDTTYYPSDNYLYNRTLVETRYFDNQFHDFIVTEYEDINLDMILSENYNGEIISRCPNEDIINANTGFYTDNLNLEYYPWKCVSRLFDLSSNITSTIKEIYIRFDLQTNYNKFIIKNIATAFENFNEILTYLINWEFNLYGYNHTNSNPIDTIKIIEANITNQDLVLTFNKNFHHLLSITAPSDDENGYRTAIISFISIGGFFSFE